MSRVGDRELKEKGEKIEGGKNRRGGGRGEGRVGKGKRGT